MTDPLVLAHVIRDVLDPFISTVSFRVLYNNRLLFNGTDLRPSAVVNRPKIEIGGTDLRVFYTIVSYLICINVCAHTHTLLIKYIYTKLLILKRNSVKMFFSNKNIMCTTVLLLSLPFFLLL